MIAIDNVNEEHIAGVFEMRQLWQFAITIGTQGLVILLFVDQRTPTKSNTQLDYSYPTIQLSFHLQNKIPCFFFLFFKNCYNL